MKKTALDYIYIFIQLLLFILWLKPPISIGFQATSVLPLDGILLTVIGVLIILIGLVQLNTNLTPFPTPNTGSKLVSKGVYGFIRHPIYTGIILGAIGLAINTNSLSRLIIGFSLWILFEFKARYEEKRLLEKFPEYEAYMGKTGRFFPKAFGW